MCWRTWEWAGPFALAGVRYVSNNPYFTMNFYAVISLPCPYRTFALTITHHHHLRILLLAAPPLSMCLFALGIASFVSFLFCPDVVIVALVFVLTWLSWHVFLFNSAPDLVQLCTLRLNDRSPFRSRTVGYVSFHSCFLIFVLTWLSTHVVSFDSAPQLVCDVL